MDIPRLLLRVNYVSSCRPCYFAHSYAVGRKAFLFLFPEEHNPSQQRFACGCAVKFSARLSPPHTSSNIIFPLTDSNFSLMSLFYRIFPCLRFRRANQSIMILAPYSRNSSRFSLIKAGKWIQLFQPNIF